MSEFSAPVLSLKKSDWSMLRIPHVPILSLGTIAGGSSDELSRRNLAAFIEHKLKLGHVAWVDFDSRAPPHVKTSRGAYVRFDYWFDTPHVRNVRDDIERNGGFLCRGYQDGDLFRAFDCDEYMILEAAPLSICGDMASPLPDNRPEQVEVLQAILRKARILVHEFMNESACDGTDHVQEQNRRMKELMGVLSSATKPEETQQNDERLSKVKGLVENLITGKHFNDTFIWTAEEEFNKHKGIIRSIQSELEGMSST
jgi:hypothetical protein